MKEARINTLQESFEKMKDDYSELESEYKNFQDQYNYLQSDYEEAKSRLEDYEKWQGHLNYYRVYYGDWYHWGYANYSYLSYWKSKERTYPTQTEPIDIGLGKYIKPEFEWSRINSIAEAIDDTTNSDKEYAERALDYVHNAVYYMSDENSTGEKEYWRYPTETIFDHLGDCEDTVLLYASLLKAQNLPLVILEFPEHMAVGVGIEDFYGIYYEQKSRKYFFAETTSNKFDEDKRRERDYRIGEKPIDLPDETYIHEI